MKSPLYHQTVRGLLYVSFCGLPGIVGRGSGCMPSWLIVVEARGRRDG